MDKMHDFNRMRHIRLSIYSPTQHEEFFRLFFQELGSKNHLNIQYQTHISWLLAWLDRFLFGFVLLLLFKFMLSYRFGAKPMSDTQEYMRITNVKKVLIGLKEMGNRQKLG